MKIYLRSVKPEDGTSIVKWRNSPKVRNHSFTKATLTLESNEEFYQKNIVTGKYQQYIVERIDEQFCVASYPISTVYLKDIDNENHRCELCIFTSDDEEWNTESQAIAVKLMVEKAFTEFGMHKVYSYVFPRFPDEVELLKKSGFEVESILREEAFDEEGQYVDVVRMTIFKS